MIVRKTIAAGIVAASLAFPGVAGAFVGTGCAVGTEGIVTAISC